MQRNDKVAAQYCVRNPRPPSVFDLVRELLTENPGRRDSIARQIPQARSKQYDKKDLASTKHGLQFGFAMIMTVPSTRPGGGTSKAEFMTVEELFERILKVHTGDTSASHGCNLDPDPCPNWFLRLEWPDRFTLTMIDFFLVKEMGFSPANYSDLTPYAEGDPITTRYYEWRPLRPELGSYYSNHWFLEWISAETGNAYQVHLLTAPRDSEVWIYSKFDLDIFLTWGGQHLEGEDCHFVSPSLLHWRSLIERISKAESGPMAA